MLVGVGQWILVVVAEGSVGYSDLEVNDGSAVFSLVGRVVAFRIIVRHYRGGDSKSEATADRLRP